MKGTVDLAMAAAWLVLAVSICRTAIRDAESAPADGRRGFLRSVGFLELEKP